MLENCARCSKNTRIDKRFHIFPFWIPVRNLLSHVYYIIFIINFSGLIDRTIWKSKSGYFPYTDFNISSLMGIYIFQYKGNWQKVTETARNLGQTITKFDSESQTLLGFFFSFIKKNFYADINSESLLM